MTLSQAIAGARRTLASASIDDARIECELLLRHALNISRVRLYQDLNKELAPEQEAAFWHLVERRLGGEPIAYITGHREFYGLDFHVDRRVLIPRPETELLVEKAISIAPVGPVEIAEIGTGCGAVAICLALNLPQARVYATDSSADALEVARLNGSEHGVADRIVFLQGDMLAPLPGPVDIIVANLPYVSDSELPQGMSFEPLLALNGGPDGLDRIRQLCCQLSGKLRPGGYLVLEIGKGQKEAVASLLSGSFPGAGIEITPDLSGIDRVVSLNLAQEQRLDLTSRP